LNTLNDLVAIEKNNLDWPQRPSGILIMGKRQGTKKENRQLWGRVAMSTALWYSAPRPKPYLLFVAADIHGPTRTPDAEIVKSWLIHEFGIPADYVVLRQKTNCTLLEVRAVRAISRAYGLTKIFAVTHLYHAPRTQRYINEVLPDAAVIPVHPDILNEIVFPTGAEALFKRLQLIIEDSLPSSIDAIREQVIEWFLNHAHTLDPRGRFERWLAKVLRPDLVK
jgi:hypothetical protein